MQIANRATGKSPLARFSLWAVILLTSAAILLTSGCFRAEPPADVTIINGNEPESLDPHIVTGVSEMRITKALFDGLTKLDPRTGTVVPGLAEHWELSADNRVYTFHLRSNAVWSTGDPITAEDVLWSWYRSLDPMTAGDYTDQLFRVKNAKAWHEGKITGLAAYGKPGPLLEKFRGLFQLNVLELSRFPYGKEVECWQQYKLDETINLRRKINFFSESDFGSHYAKNALILDAWLEAETKGHSKEDIAYACQKVTEEVMCGLLDAVIGPRCVLCKTWTACTCPDWRQSVRIQIVGWPVSARRTHYRPTPESSR